MTVIERKYVLTKVAKGDYLLPGNSGRTLWRIFYFEDRQIDGYDGIMRGWSVYRFNRPMGPAVKVDVEDWDQWDTWSSGPFSSRGDAIQEALRAESGEVEP